MLLIMIQTILAFFGYIKVPEEAIQMSIHLEDDFKELIQIFLPSGENIPEYKKLAEHLKEGKRAMEVMTKFLRSGKWRMNVDE